MSTSTYLLDEPQDATSHLTIAAIVEEGPQWSRLVRALESAGLSLNACVRDASALPQNVDFDVVIAYGDGDRRRLHDLICSTREILDSSVGLLVIWASAEPNDARIALRAGADGFVRAVDLESTLAPALFAVGCGLVCVPRQMRAPLHSENLSMREKQVLAMLVMGYTNAEIAGKLYLAESTIKSHLSSAYAKLGVRSRKDAASMILDPVGGLGPGILAISAA